MKRVNILTAHCVQGAAALEDVALQSRTVKVTYSKEQQDEYSAHIMALNDGRQNLDSFSLDKSGFQLFTLDSPIKHPLSTSWADGKSVAKYIYPVAEKSIAQATGAPRVLAFDHALRDPNVLDKEENAGIKRDDPNATPFLGAPINAAHNDYTVRSGHTRTRQLLEPYFKSTKTLDDVLKGRFAIINFWYPLETVTEMPLAMCEWGSVEPPDVQTIHFDYGHRTGEVYRVRHNPAHNWVYYSKMQPNEALLLKTFDSSDKVAQFAVHSAVPYREPGVPEKPRRSLEVRCLVFYDADLPQDVTSQFVAPHIKLGYSESRACKTTVLPPSEDW